MRANANELIEKLTAKIANGQKLTASETSVYVGLVNKLVSSEPKTAKAPAKTRAKAPAKAPAKTRAKAPVKAPACVIVEYSEKCYAVFGDTKPVKDQLISIGGRFNRFLKNGKNVEPGWIFSKKIVDTETIKKAIS